MFYQGGPIDICAHFPGPVAQYNAGSDYNAVWNAGMYLAHSRILNSELLNKDKYVVTEQAPLIILDKKSSVCMAKNGKDTKHTRKIDRRMHFKKMAKSEICTRQCGCREVCSCQTLEPKILGKMNWIIDLDMIY